MLTEYQKQEIEKLLILKYSAIVEANEKIIQFLNTIECTIENVGEVKGMESVFFNSNDVEKSYNVKVN